LNKVVLGGIDHQSLLLKGTQEEVSLKMKELIELSKEIRLIPGPGCVILPQTPEKNLEAAKKAVEIFSNI